MKVGILTPRILDRPTGIVVYTRELVGALGMVDPRCEIVLLSRSASDKLPDWFHGHQTIRLGPPAGGSRRNPMLPLQVLRTGRDLGLDIVHATGNIALFTPIESCFKKVVTVHDVGPLAHPGDRSKKEALVHAAFIPPLRWTTDAVIADSVATAADLTRFAGIPAGLIDVIPLGTNGQQPWAREPDESETFASDLRPYFLAVGDVALHKNLNGVLEAFGVVLASRHDANLIVAGRLGFGGPELVAQAEAKLKDSVSFAGYVSDDELDALYRDAVALVAPSFYEGFGLTVLEAMARGVPVITSNVSSLPEVAGDAALLVDPARPAEIAGAMLKILEQPELAQNLRVKGVERARQFTWRHTAEQTIQVYERVLAGVPPDATEWRNEVAQPRSIARTWLATLQRGMRTDGISWRRSRGREGRHGVYL
ncbi:MAG TPA: glycosyltransferase family 1 protein [Chloroflexota bacterium]|jgi:alpha-1,3-rhamnosyl/mannosyltransferase|nr:glycosyltransferase family 1 protein [Chloroflexota bacterium]